MWEIIIFKSFLHRRINHVCVTPLACTAVTLRAICEGLINNLRVHSYNFLAYDSERKNLLPRKSLLLTVNLLHIQIKKNSKYAYKRVYGIPFHEFILNKMFKLFFVDYWS